MHPKIDGILETSLYVSDLRRSIRFYEETFGFRVISEFGERGCAMHAGARQVLLLFKKGLRWPPKRLTMGTANYTSRLPFPLPNWPTGNRGSTREESRWKRSEGGIWAAGAFTCEIWTGICLNSPHRARGPCIEDGFSPTDLLRACSGFRHCLGHKIMVRYTSRKPTLFQARFKTHPEICSAR